MRSFDKKLNKIFKLYFKVARYEPYVEMHTMQEWILKFINPPETGEKNTQNDSNSREIIEKEFVDKYTSGIWFIGVSYITELDKLLYFLEAEILQNPDDISTFFYLLFYNTFYKIIKGFESMLKMPGFSDKPNIESAQMRVRLAKSRMSHIEAMLLGKDIQVAQNDNIPYFANFKSNVSNFIKKFDVLADSDNTFYEKLQKAQKTLNLNDLITAYFIGILDRSNRSSSLDVGANTNPISAYPQKDGEFLERFREINNMEYKKICDLIDKLNTEFSTIEGQFKKFFYKESTHENKVCLNLVNAITNTVCIAIQNNQSEINFANVIEEFKLKNLNKLSHQIFVSLYVDFITGDFQGVKLTLPERAWQYLSSLMTLIKENPGKSAAAFLLAISFIILASHAVAVALVASHLVTGGLGVKLGATTVAANTGLGKTGLVSTTSAAVSHAGGCGLQILGGWSLHRSIKKASEKRARSIQNTVTFLLLSHHEALEEKVEKFEKESKGARGLREFISQEFAKRNDILSFNEILAYYSNHIDEFTKLAAEVDQTGTDTTNIKNNVRRFINNVEEHEREFYVKKYYKQFSFWKIKDHQFLPDVQARLQLIVDRTPDEKKKQERQEFIDQYIGGPVAVHDFNTLINNLKEKNINKFKPWISILFSDDFYNGLKEQRQRVEKRYKLSKFTYNGRLDDNSVHNFSAEYEKFETNNQFSILDMSTEAVKELLINTLDNNQIAELILGRIFEHLRINPNNLNLNENYLSIVISRYKSFESARSLLEDFNRGNKFQPPGADISSEKERLESDVQRSKAILVTYINANKLIHDYVEKNINGESIDLFIVKALAIAGDFSLRIWRVSEETNNNQAVPLQLVFSRTAQLSKDKPFIDLLMYHEPKLTFIKLVENFTEPSLGHQPVIQNADVAILSNSY